MADAIITAILIICALLALRSCLRKKKSHGCGSGCGGNCGGCSHGAHSEKNK